MGRSVTMVTDLDTPALAPPSKCADDIIRSATFPAAHAPCRDDSPQGGGGDLWPYSLAALGTVGSRWACLHPLTTPTTPEPLRLHLNHCHHLHHHTPTYAYPQPLPQNPSHHPFTSPTLPKLLPQTHSQPHAPLPPPLNHSHLLLTSPTTH